MKQRKKIIFVAACSIIVAAAAVGLISSKGLVSNSIITGDIVRITDRPNQAEDGYYGLLIQSDSGQKYTIDATGYLNTPVSPGSRGEACIDIPKVDVGDRVEFNLPRSEGQQNTFDICYKKDLSGYYFKLK